MYQFWGRQPWDRALQESVFGTGGVAHRSRHEGFKVENTSDKATISDFCTRYNWRTFEALYCSTRVSL